VVRVYDTGVFQGYPYLAMELVEGLTLRHYLSLSDEDLSSDQAWCAPSSTTARR
jgi:serine/threonine protein kinase